MVKRVGPPVTSFLAAADSFFKDAYEELERKSRDYQVNGKAFGDIFSVSEDLNMRPIFVLYIHMSKHLQALRRFIEGNDLKSEDIYNRLTDIANYSAMMRILVELERRRESIGGHPKDS